MNTIVPEIFARNVPGTYEILEKAKIGIAGCGGLGSNVAVALTRTGIGNLILADFDYVELSNLNRQHYFHYDVGKAKVDAIASHLKAINPDINLTLLQRVLSPEDIPVIFHDADILIEAFDKAESKIWLIESWSSTFPEKPVICASGISGCGNSETLKITNSGSIYIVGDQHTDMSCGLCAARVSIAANIQANIAIELLLKNKGTE